MAVNWQAYLPVYEAEFGLPPGLLGALVRAESGGLVNAGSPMGAQGLTQLMPATARSLGVTNILDPLQNLRGGAKYLSQQLQAFRNVEKALAAYNAGPGAVRQYGGIPPYGETRAYVPRVIGYWKESPRYGTPVVRGQVRPTVAGASGTPSRTIPGTPGSPGWMASRTQQVALPAAPKPIPYNPLPAPVRKEVPGLDDGSVARLQFAFTDAPEIGNAHLQNRVKQQSNLDADYGKAIDRVNTLNAKNYSASINSMFTPIKPGTITAFAGKAPVAGTPARVVPGSPGSTRKPLPIPSGNSGWIRTPNGFQRTKLPHEQGWQFLQRLGTKGFGLQNDPGNNQTTGGRHEVDSWHYRNAAIDFGNARNSTSSLDSWYNFLNHRRRQLGVVELLDEARGTSNHHIHGAVA